MAGKAAVEYGDWVVHLAMPDEVHDSGGARRQLVLPSTHSGHRLPGSGGLLGRPCPARVASAVASTTSVQSNCISSSRPTWRTRSQTLSQFSSGRPRTDDATSSIDFTSRSAWRMGSITAAGGNG